MEVDDRVEEGVNVCKANTISRLQIAPFMGLMNMLKARYIEEPIIYKTVLAVLFDHNPELPDNHERTLRYIRLLLDEDLANLLVMFLLKQRQTLTSEAFHTAEQAHDSLPVSLSSVKNTEDETVQDKPVVVSTDSPSQSLSIPVPINVCPSHSEQSLGINTLPVSTDMIHMQNIPHWNFYQGHERPSILYPPQAAVSFPGYPFLQNNYRYPAMPWMYMPYLEHVQHAPTLGFQQLQTSNVMLPNQQLSQERSLDLSKNSPGFSSLKVCTGNTVNTKQQETTKSTNRPVLVKRRALSTSQVSVPTKSAISLEISKRKMGNGSSTKKVKQVETEIEVDKSRNQTTITVTSDNRTNSMIGSTQSKVQVNDQSESIKSVLVPGLLDLNDQKENGDQHLSPHLQSTENTDTETRPHQNFSPKLPHPIKQFPSSSTAVNRSGRHSLSAFPYSQEITFPNGKSSIISFKGDSLPDRTAQFNIESVTSLKKMRPFTFPGSTAESSAFKIDSQLKHGKATNLDEVFTEVRNTSVQEMNELTGMKFQTSIASFQPVCSYIKQGNTGDIQVTYSKSANNSHISQSKGSMMSHIQPQNCPVTSKE